MSKKKTSAKEKEKKTEPTKTEEKKTEPTKTEKKKKEPIKVSLKEKLLNDYLTRYESYQKQSKPKNMITNLVNIYNLVEKDPPLIYVVIDYFRKKKNLLAEKVALQGLELYVDPKHRIKTMVFYHVLKTVVFRKKERISFDAVSDVVPSKLIETYKKALLK